VLVAAVVAIAFFFLVQLHQKVEAGRNPLVSSSPIVVVVVVATAVFPRVDADVDADRYHVPFDDPFRQLVSIGDCCLLCVCICVAITAASIVAVVATPSTTHFRHDRGSREDPVPPRTLGPSGGRRKLLLSCGVVVRVRVFGCSCS